MTGTVTITTPWLEPGCEAHQLLEEAGCEVSFSSEINRRGTGVPARDHIAAAQALIVGTEPLTAEDLGAIKGLGVVARTGTGYDNVDLQAAAEYGITVCNTPGANRQSVVELTIALMLSLARNIPDNAAGTKAGRWDQPSGREIRDAVLGVIGLGDIGRAVARAAVALGMRVIGHSPRADASALASDGITYRSMDDLLAEADFLTVHVALTEATRHLLSDEAFATMKKSSYVINTSRGGVIDEAAMVRALQDGQIAGAALDVIEGEPIAADDALLGAPNLILTAHIAGATAQARERSARIAARQIIDYFAGQRPQYAVTATQD